MKLITAILAALAMLACATTATAQERHHPAQDAPIHEKFYSTWMMPDRPDMSCCNKQDCYPTEARFSEGQWWAQRREDGQWLPVPWEKVERNRDTPDGRSHMCAPPPGRSVGDVVFCFSLGGGT